MEREGNKVHSSFAESAVCGSSNGGNSLPKLTNREEAFWQLTGADGIIRTRQWIAKELGIPERLTSMYLCRLRRKGRPAVVSYPPTLDRRIAIQILFDGPLSSLQLAKKLFTSENCINQTIRSMKKMGLEVPRPKKLQKPTKTSVNSRGHTQELSNKHNAIRELVREALSMGLTSYSEIADRVTRRAWELGIKDENYAMCTGSVSHIVSTLKSSQNVVKF